jgi:putative addiction module component (TIGR02574 family)
VKKRLELIEKLWDSLAADASNIPLSDAPASELDRRINEMDQDSKLGIPWETVLANIRARR